jgi:hypothetical protein
MGSAERADDVPVRRYRLLGSHVTGKVNTA